MRKAIHLVIVPYLDSTNITDGGLKTPTGTISDHFIAEEKRLTTDIIANEFGNLGPNGEIYSKVSRI